tara:strand:- start:307 stop:1017 length:711 start_codon:yes stop_codon:yes gene_type:complete
MNKLTEKLVRRAEIQDKQYKMYDGDGMFLLIHPNGSKYWRMKYTFDGKSKLASFGVWPKVSLKEAREKRNNAKLKIKSGINPVEEKRQKKWIQQKQSSNKHKKEFTQSTETSIGSIEWFRSIIRYGKVGDTDTSLEIMKSTVFGSVDYKNVSLLEKHELNEILGNIIRNRRELFKIIWNFYISIPTLNIAVLFVLLLVIMDLIPALFTIILYFIVTVFTSVVLSLCDEKINDNAGE